MVHVRVIGGLEVVVDGEPVPLPEAARAWALLAWLAVHPGQHSRADLAGRLRPDVPQESARKSLRQTAWSLRAALEGRAPDVLAGTRERIGLDPGVEVDLVRMRRLRAEGRLEEAAAILGGELLPGLDEEWAIRAREEHRAEEADLLERLAAAAEREGRAADAIAWTRRRIAADPLAEGAHRDLMRRLAAAGERSSALGAYEALRGALRRELGTLPSPETRALAEDLRRGAAPAADEAPAPSAPRPGAGDAGPARIPAPLVRDGPLVGRDEATRRLGEELAASRAGAPRVVLLAGEPGIGKTRLAAWTAERAAADGGIVLYGRADEDGLVPYAPFAEAFGRLLADGPEGLGDAPLADLAPIVPALAAARAGDGEDAETRRHRAFEALRRVLERLAATRPVLLVLDDLHWADRATLAALRHLGRMLEGAPVMILGTYRDTDLGPGHPLLATVAELRRELPVVSLALAGLDDEETARLVAGRGGAEVVPDPRELRARTAGNPFFIQEVVAHAVETGDTVSRGVPLGVLEVLERRIDRLGEGVAPTLVTAALLGPQPLTEVVIEAVGDEDEALGALEAAERAGLLAPLEPSGERYAFAHALVVDALTARVSPPRRARLHARLADALAGRHGSDPGVSAAEVARHMVQAAPAGRAEAAREWSCAAARESRDAFAYAEAAEHYRRALEVSGATPPVRAGLLADVGDCWNRAALPDRARPAFREAFRLAAEAQDPSLCARAALGFGGLGTTIRHADEEVVELLEAALADCPAGDAGAADRGRLLARLAVELYYADRGRAAELSAEGVASARASGDPDALAAALNARRVSIWDAWHAEERLAVSGEMVALADRAGSAELALQGRNWMVVDLMELGRRAEAEEAIERYAADATAVRLPRYRWYVPLWRAMLADLSGDFAAGEAHRSEAVEEGGLAQDPNADLFAFVQHLQALLDSWSLEGPRFEEAHQESMRRRAASPVPQAWTTWLPVQLALTGRTAEAREWMDAIAADDFAAIPSDANWHVVCEVAEGVALLGDAARAAVVHERLAPHARLSPVVARGVACFGSAEYFLARTAATLGAVDEAEERFARAAERNAALGARPRLAVTLLRHAELVAAGGDAARARDLAGRALAEAEAVGLVPVARAAVALRAG